MFLQSIDILLQDPIVFIRVFSSFLATAGTALLLAITIHEFSHALIAYNLGDSTAHKLGRLSLNPIKHLDPMGSMMLILVGFGWGKPVPVNPYNLRNGSKNGMSMVSLAGPLSNLITAAICSIPIRLNILDWHSPFRFTGLAGSGPMELLSTILGFMIFYNLILAIFNLIPLYPLDGSKILIGILPSNTASTFSRWEPAGPAILLSIIMIDWITGLNILWSFLAPITDMLVFILLGQKLG